MAIKINPELQRLIPPLTSEEYAQLEANLLSDGCRDPLVVWAQLPDEWQPSNDQSEMTKEEIENHFNRLNGFEIYWDLLEVQFGGPYALCKVRTRYNDKEIKPDDINYQWLDTRDPDNDCESDYDCILLDGHNRLKICEAHRLTYDIVELALPDIDAAMNWMDANQLGRRNLTRELMSLLRGRRYDREKAQGQRTDLTCGKNYQKSTTAERLSKEYNVSEKTIRNDGKFYEECEKDPELEKVVMARGDVKKYKKDKQREERTQAIEARAQEIRPPEELQQAFVLPERTYPVVYADPPWRYDYSETDSRKIENQYDTMTLEDICGLPIQTVAAPDAALFLWATSPKLREALRVIDVWGFTYRTCAVWDKQKIGMGYYFRQQHELLLVATRGDIPAPPEKARVSSVISETRGKHSKKPERVYQIIEAMYPDLSKIELFARNKRDGWESWGNQV